MMFNGLQPSMLLLACVHLLVFLPNNCMSESLTISNILIEYVNRGDYTEFKLTSSLRGTLNNVWMGVGFGSYAQMVTLLKLHHFFKF